MYKYIYLKIKFILFPIISFIIIIRRLVNILLYFSKLVSNKKNLNLKKVIKIIIIINILYLNLIPLINSINLCALHYHL
jgi:hypothetical protein